MRSQFMSRVVFVVGVLGLVCSATAGVLATPRAAPEIDGASLSTGMALLSAGVLMLRARWQAK